MLEYKVIRIYDEDSGLPSGELVEQALNEHAKDGWRLSAVTTNEIGRNSNTQGYGGIKQTTNATIDCTLIIMEREYDEARTQEEQRREHRARAAAIRDSVPTSKKTTWVCPNCGKENANYTYTCNCGTPRPSR